ncbi:T9SS type A sorting domain-containing protein [Flavobacterium sp. LM4]|uniref:T9SS type A sorting domain-containing protein n=1 Tax=Flavobacterium sp. LM4 TaxID=1938609 RepID=UPI0009CA197A|nr:T9SS type A sorting domain-containing protein [Flavobacterium sp. LM4]OOV16149.1 hypothetical protein BXU10_21435 [Flavobacterium sp. LM4]
MTKKLSYVFLLTVSLYSYSQNLLVTKRDYSNSPTYVHSLQKLNSSNGTVLNNENFTTSFPSSYSPESLTFNAQTNELFGLSDVIITKKNILTNSEASFTLPTATATDYGGIIMANNRLFVTKRDYSNSPTYIHSLQEINQTNGNVISTYTLNSSIPSLYNRDLSFSSSTNEIYGLSRNIIYKYNILTSSETTLTLPIDANTEYTDMIIAENRLFVVKRDYSVNPQVHTLLELNTTNASVINSRVFATNLINYGKIESLTFLADSHEICGIIKNQVTFVDYKIVKYDFINNTESSFDITAQASTDFGEIISTTTEQNLSVKEINQNISLKIYPNPTSNFITVQNDKNSEANFEYKIVDITGRSVKKGKSKFNEQINIESLTKGNYIIQIETENREKTNEKLIKN